MVTQSWCSGLCLASFSSLTSDLNFIILYPMGCFRFCSGLSLRAVRSRILQTVLPLTLTHVHDTAVVSGDFEMFTLDKCVFQASKMAWKNIARCRGGADGLKNPLHSQKTEPPLSIMWRLPSCVKSLLPMSAELSEDRLAFASDVCDPSRLRSQEHAASRRAVYSCGWQLSCSQRYLMDVTCRNHAFHANSPEVP